MLTVLTDTSCNTKLLKMQHSKTGDVSIDLTYSSCHWHANKITTIICNAQAGMSHLVPCECLLTRLPFMSGNHKGGIITHHHILKDTVSGAPQHKLWTYQGTSSTAEGDGTAAALKLIKVCQLPHP
jgi:hypothetical protein